MTKAKVQTAASSITNHVASVSDVLPLYRGASLGTRAFLKGRILLSRLDLVERQVPLAGEITDLGCGHGLFANYLAIRSLKRKVTGVDLSPAKIDCAQETVSDRPNIRFTCGDILEMEVAPCDAITIVDVMYLLPEDLQRQILADCRRLLKPGGKLIWKAQERHPRWKYAFTYFQELIAIRAGFTQGRKEKLCFMSREEALAALKDAGFTASIVEMPRLLPYTDILYLGT